MFDRFFQCVSPSTQRLTAPRLLNCLIPVATILFLSHSGSAHGAAEGQVPRSLWDVQTTCASSGRLLESGTSLGRQSFAAQQFNFLQRIPLDKDGWYFGLGTQAEAFSFHGPSVASVEDMHDVSGVLSLEYFVGSMQAAALSLKPGFYFTDKATAASLDMPVQLVSGVPLTKSLSAVIGGSAARFYRQPIPIAGLSWTLSPSCRVEAVFPEPSVVWSGVKGAELKVGGELQSGGFKTSSGADVEFYSYQLKGRASYRVGRALTVSGAVGYELERSFDNLRTGQRLKSEGAVIFQAGAGLAF